VEQKTFIPFSIQTPEIFRGKELEACCSKKKKCCKKYKKTVHCKKCPKK
jgi:hypothetical protein